MFRYLSVLGASMALTAICFGSALAQDTTSYYPVGVFTPRSSVSWNLTETRHAHTNLRVLRVTTRPPHAGAQPLIGTGAFGSYGPKDLRGFYKEPATALGSGVIALVEAYDDKYLVSEFNSFSSNYSLPQETGSGAVLQVHNMGASSGSADGSGWDLEVCLDTQVVHSMAPKAKIVVVEAKTQSATDLFAAVQYARSIGATDISMSWNLGEGAATTSTENILTGGSGINFASAGDNGAFYAIAGYNYAAYPASSTNVVSAGGTTSVTSNTTPGKLIATLAWEEGGGGPSAVFSKPSYQSGVVGTDPSFRSTPDLSANADPNTPFGVFNISYNNYYNGTTGVYVFFEGGTSESSPLLAALQNASGHSYANTQAFLTHLYTNLDTAGYFNDIKTGYNGYLAADDYDMATGVGTPLGLNGM